MGAQIHNSATVLPKTRKLQRSSIRLSVKAVEDCLSKEGLDPEEIGIFINTGIFRDKHIGEPAIAALIHGDLSINCGSPFCFDLNNGGVGYINALEVCSNLIENGESKAGIVVSGDAIPRRIDRWVFPYSPAATAITLKKGPAESGFIEFFHKSFPEHADLQTSALRWDKPDFRKSNRHILKINQDKEYAQQCFESAKITLTEFFSNHKLSAADFDLLLYSHSPKQFGIKLKTWLRLPKDSYGKILDGGEIHTAGLGYSLSRAMTSSKFHQARNVLFIAVGSGIQVSLAWYRNLHQHE
ncbi:MAG: hypothetical protein KAH17_03060 [Bacteroidales bacterium]|nr:hypothetical protein [Bacteroidales bacterium]